MKPTYKEKCEALLALPLVKGGMTPKRQTFVAGVLANITELSDKRYPSVDQAWRIDGLYRDLCVSDDEKQAEQQAKSIQQQAREFLGV